MKSPKRQFDPTVPLFARSTPLPDTEDPELTRFLEGRFEELLSLSETPPPCPRCQGSHTVLSSRAAHPRPALPVFRCLSCDMHFRRTTGTPIAGLKLHQPWFKDFLRLLSQQRPNNDAARILGVKAVTVARYVKRLRQWLLELDPSGYWEAKVRLGMEIRPDAACPYCHARQSLHYRGFKADDGERQCHCDQCGRYVRLGQVTGGKDISTLDHRVVVRPPSPRRKGRETG
ncbi:hypothetical protein ATN84_24705 [Paramesorhizobium deserti]|uniref:DUF746 domain-containing protein n=1 Tax=Paramesorhizobium deserti TaxID=1494590 RepID=A0A135HXU0_9HYPH|nr:DUF746 domain-containing protein [Paramesorhizobium deserti]KXF78012.1 hypothetical protein ATN84_24705 [Paramesorhizobium deserti]